MPTPKQSCCTLGKPVSYKWFGEYIPLVEDVPITKLISEFFAKKFNEALSQHKQIEDEIEKQKCLLQIDALIENRLNRISKGKTKPGIDVKPVQMAYEENRQVFEFRWKGETPLLKNILLRHYAGEPQNFTPCCFGLHIHIKDTSSDDKNVIRNLQNREIELALQYYRQHEQTNWSKPILS